MLGERDFELLYKKLTDLASKGTNLEVRDGVYLPSNGRHWTAIL